jgi:(p)ppGpp synthase/HD superfamily hydrolase
MSPQIQAARAAAEAAHGAQRYGDAPYVTHLDHVVEVVRRFVPGDHPGRLRLEIAAYLHDTLEDTALERAAVAAQFGEAVAALVHAVSDGPGRNRKERKARTYPRIRATGPEAVLLKLADRVANVEAAAARAPDKLAMYRKEWWGFYGALYDPAPGPHQRLWEHLEGLLEANRGG